MSPCPKGVAKPFIFLRLQSWHGHLRHSVARDAGSTTPVVIEDRASWSQTGSVVQQSCGWLDYIARDESIRSQWCCS